MKKIGNLKYALKSLFRYSKKRLFCSFLLYFIKYFRWVFTSAVFIKFIVYELEEQRGFADICSFVLISGAIFFIFGMIISYVQNVVYPTEQIKIYDGVYGELYNKAINVDLSCFENDKFYNKYTMAIDGADKKIESIADNFAGMIFGTMGAVAMVYSMMIIDKYLILFLILPCLGTLWLGNEVNKKHYAKYKDSVHAEKIMNYVNRVMYLPQYVKEIRTTNVFNVITRQYGDATEEKRSVNVKYSKKLIFLDFWRITFTFTSVFEGVLLYASYKNMVHHTLSFASLTVLSEMMVSVVWMLTGLFNSINGLNKDVTFIENIVEFLKYEGRIDENQDGLIPEREIRSIEFRKVSFSYEGKMVLKDLSFTVNGKRKVAIVGENGAGKTTLIKLLLRYYDPTSGAILVNGIDIRDYNLQAYRNLYSIAFQDSKVWGTTIRNNILMGTEKSDSDVLEVLEKVKLKNKIETIESGIDAIMTKEFNDNGILLSGGEQQKLCVARAFLSNNPISIFDEPSSLLDPIAEYDLFNSIIEYGNDKNLFIISHRLSSTKKADLILLIEDGMVKECGSYEELIKAGGRYSQMYRRQAHEYWPINV